MDYCPSQGKHRHWILLLASIAVPIQIAAHSNWEVQTQKGCYISPAVWNFLSLDNLEKGGENERWRGVVPLTKVGPREARCNLTFLWCSNKTLISPKPVKFYILATTKQMLYQQAPNDNMFSLKITKFVPSHGRWGPHSVQHIHTYKRQDNHWQEGDSQQITSFHAS